MNLQEIQNDYTSLLQKACKNELRITQELVIILTNNVMELYEVAPEEDRSRILQKYSPLILQKRSELI